MKLETCKVKGCKGTVELLYYGYPVCAKCWSKHCSGQINLKRKLKIKEEPSFPMEIKVDGTLRGYV